MSESGKVVVRFFELLNERELDAAHALLADGYLEHNPLAVKIRGRDEHLAFMTAVLDSFPDLMYEVRSVVSQTDEVAVHWVATGTHRGEYSGRAATGRSVTLWGWWFGRVADGRMAEAYGGWDKAGLLTQLDGG